jgi:hypothetical protein
MSWEEELTKRPGLNRRNGSPLALIGFTIGLLAMSTSVFLYYWLLAWIAPLALVVLFALASLVAGRHSERVAYLADGALASAAFGVIFAVVGAIVVAN